MAEQLTPHGFAVAGVAIRSSAHAQFPAQLHDIKAAIRWLRAHAAQYQLDPAEFGIMGESSGGWTAAMAGLTGDDPELEGTVGVRAGSSRVQAIVPIDPPTDSLHMDARMVAGGASFNRDFGLAQGHADARSPESRLIGGPIGTRPEAVRRANPAAYARAEAPPCLLLHGQRDQYVPSHQSVLLYEALAAASAAVTLILLPRGEHGHWAAFLTDPVVSAGAAAWSARSGQRQPEQPIDLSWATVIHSFAQHLRPHTAAAGGPA